MSGRTVASAYMGELLERLILHLSNTGDRSHELNDVVFRICGLQPAVIDGGYV